ncbi:protein kinase domain-containing protein [Thermococcus prieurii]
MVTKNMGSLVVIALLLVAILASSTPAAASKSTSMVNIDTTAPGVSVYLDGKYVGVTPIHGLKVSEGIHTIRLEKNMYGTVIVLFNAVPGRNITLNVPMVFNFKVGENPILNVRTSPPGAEIELNGVIIGTSPVYNYTLIPGMKYQLQINLRGYNPENLTLNPDMHTLYYVYITLTRELTTNSSGSPGETSITSKLLGLALLIAVGVVAVAIGRKRHKKEKKPPSPRQPRESVSKPLEGFPPGLLDRYEPLEFLGEGGFAKVFKVKRKKDGKTVALKVPRIDEKTSKTFLREVSTWFQLNHPNVVKLYDADILPVPHLEMEFVEGAKVDGKLVRTLEELPKPVDEETALRLIKGIAEGLKHAHSKGIVHRDLKPGNILLKADLTPKITDWGLAKIGTMSSGRSVMGYTPLYAAPEHLMPSKFGNTDHRTDVWQLGTIFYELLTGRVPFEGYTYEEVFGKITDENYRHKPPSDFNPALAKYDGLFEKLLAKRKEDRYGSVEEFLRDLEKLEESEKRKQELESQVEELKKTLARSVEALKKSKTADEIRENGRLVVQTLSKLALAYAELNRKAELLNTLSDLKFYTTQHREELGRAIETLELMIRENLPVREDFIERLKVLLHKIERENGV